MTIFGKIVLASFMIVVASGVYFGLSSYVKEDTQGEETTIQVVSTSTESASPLVETASTTEASSTQTGTSTKQGSSKKIPFTEFMSKGGSYTCDITQNVSTMTSKGTVYMHDALVRLELATSLAGQSMNTTMIARDGYMYSWTDLSPTKGYKTKIVASATEKPTTYTWNGSQVGDYTCEAWKADDTRFELPKTVTFTIQ
jgi:hypothetical protein